VLIIHKLVMPLFHQNNQVDVLTGDAQFAIKGSLLRSNAIGSCVVVIVYNNTREIGGMAHVLLPGYSTNSNDNFKYAGEAIDYLINNIRNKDDNDEIWGFLVGGANVLKRENDDIGEKNISSAQNYLRDKNVEILTQSTGGTKRRSVEFDIENKCIYFSIGDSDKMILWKK